MRLQRLFPVAFIAIAFAGCGGDDGSSSSSGSTAASSEGADPAQVIPADAPVYIEAVVRPEGDQADNVNALLDRFLGDKTVTDLIDEALAEEGDDTYADDIEPWLGQRAGIGVINLQAEEPSFVAAIQVTDPGAAETAIAESEGVRGAGKAGDVDLYVDTDDQTLAGVSDDFLFVAQTEEDITQAIETADGDSIADNERFTAAWDELPDDRLAGLYLDTQVFSEIAAADESLDGAGRALLDKVFGDGEPITGALIAEPDSARVEFTLSTAGFGPLGAFFGGESTELVADAPAGSWLVIGYKDVGETIKGALDAFAGALGGAAITGQFEQQTGLDLERDIFSWVGDLAVFVSGDTEETINGALVIGVTDADAAQAAIKRIVATAKRFGAPLKPTSLDGAEQAYSTAIPDGPGPLVMAYGNDRVVFAIGEAAAASGISPSETIEDSGLYGRARDAIDGVEPAFVIDMPTVLRVVEASGQADASFEEAKPYLEMIDLFASGAQVDGDRYRSVAAMKVK